MADVNQKIDTYLKDNLDRFIDELKMFCAQPSISTQNVGLEEMAQLVLAALEKRGMTVSLHPTKGAPVVIGRMNGKSDKTLIFYNHYDVQPPEPLELWTNPPFEPSLRNGRLYARGVSDDKGELASRLAAFDAVRAAHDGDLPCNVIFVVEGEEEIGSPNIAGVLEAEKDNLQADGCIWEFGGIDEHDAPYGYLGMRGLLGVALHVKTMNKDAHSGNAHIMPNAAWRLVRALSTLKDEEEHILIEGFYDDIISMDDLDKELFDNLPLDVFDTSREEYGLDHYLNDKQGSELYYAVFNPTCNIQGITTGYQGVGIKTVIPSEATVKIDFRLVPGQDGHDIYEKLCAHLAKHGFGDIEVELLGTIAPYKAPADNPFIQLVSDTALDAYGTDMQIIPLIGGSGPIAAFGQILGVPVANAGITSPKSNAHAPDENIVIEQFLNGTRHVARVLNGMNTL